MPLPPFWQIVAACLLAISVLAAAGVHVLARRLAAMERSRAAVEHRLTQLVYEVRRLDRLVAEIGRRGPTSHAAEPLVPLISIPDLGRDAAPGDAAGLAARHADVWTRVEAGREPRAIADEIGRPIGEVEFIAGLYRQNLAARSGGPA